MIDFGDDTPSARTNPPLQWHGGKWYLAPKIVALMPYHVHYVEPYAGGLSVLLAKNPNGVSEVANDIHLELTNFWRVLQREEDFFRFQRIVEAIPFSEEEYRSLAESQPDCLIDRAVRFFVLCRQSMAGRMKEFSALTREQIRRGMSKKVSQWLGAIEGLYTVHQRLIRVAILNSPAIKVIQQQDAPHTLFYLDPPYLHETRESKEVYDHEMSVAQHAELLYTVTRCKGKVMLSGYHSAMYHRYLKDWTAHEFNIANHAAKGKVKRRMTEVLWCNF
jgi:DNA adenine methylase